MRPPRLSDAEIAHLVGGPSGAAAATSAATAQLESRVGQLLNEKTALEKTLEEQRRELERMRKAPPAPAPDVSAPLREQVGQLAREKTALEQQLAEQRREVERLQKAALPLPPVPAGDATPRALASRGSSRRAGARGGAGQAGAGRGRGRTAAPRDDGG